MVLFAAESWGQERVPYRSLSPFAGLYHHDGVMTSNDGYRMWVSWVAESWVLRYQRLSPIRNGEHEDLQAWVRLQCRVDGRAEGYSGASPLAVELWLPMHPDLPDVPNWIHPLYWWRGLTGREFVRTPVRVAGAGDAYGAELVRHTIDYSFARPELTVTLRGGAVLAALAAGSELHLAVRGEGIALDLAFAEGGEGGQDAARRMLRHCAL